MDLTGRELRIGIRSATALATHFRMRAIAAAKAAAKLAAGEDASVPHDPQRRAFVARLRDHFGADKRDGTKLVPTFLKLVESWKSRDARAVSIAHTVEMLERFATLDKREPEPTKWLLAPVPVMIGTHRLTLAADVAYQTPNGWIVRQLLTDQEIRRPQHLRLYAAACALHFEGRPDGGPVTKVELWRLREERPVVEWTRTQLLADGPRLDRELARMAEAVAALPQADDEPGPSERGAA